MNGNRVSLLLLLLFLSATAWAQKNKTQLQKEKLRSIEKIKETEKILSEVSKNKKISMGQLAGLTRRIEQQENLIQSIALEIAELNLEIDENRDVILSLEADLKKLKEEYGAMIYAAQKSQNNLHPIVFLFSARSFEQLVMRIKYMRQYGDARRKQEQAIRVVQKSLDGKIKISEEHRMEKTKLLKEEEAQKAELQDLKEKQKNMVTALKEQEADLMDELKETKKAVAELDQEIAKVIAEEIRLAEKEAKERAAKAKQKGQAKTTQEPTLQRLSPEMVALSNNFTENKRKLPWPVNGFITQKFGKQQHPVLRGIMIENDGINIQTNQNENVKVIFDGEVRRISSNPLLGLSVVVKHGEYYTIYTCLKDVNVTPGQLVKRGQSLGNVLLNTQGISELRFMLWKNFSKLNPEEWLQP